LGPPGVCTTVPPEKLLSGFSAVGFRLELR